MRWTSDIIEGTIFLDIPHRLTNRLITLADQYGIKAGGTARIEVKLSQESLGQMLGSAHESINKGLKTLEYKGLIETKSGHISVLNMDALEDFAEHQDDG